MTTIEQHKIKPKSRKIQTTVYLTPETHKYIKKRKLSMEHVIELGVRADKDNPELIRRVGVLEEEYYKHDRHITKLYGRIEQLGELLEKK